MDYEQEKKELDELLRQSKQDFIQYRDQNNKRYNEASTIEQKAKIHAELEARRQVFLENQDTLKRNFEAGYNANVEAEKLKVRAERAVETEKLNKKLLPDYEEHESAANADIIRELDEIKRKEALIREQNRNRSIGRKL